MLYFGSKKQGYNVDGVYSYGLANSEYVPFMHFGGQAWIMWDVKAVLQEVRQLFGIEALVEIDRQQGSAAVRILLSEDGNM